MKRTLCTGALVVLTAMTAACGFKIFEDVGSDPHPPSVEITELVLGAEPVAPTATLSAREAAPARPAGAVSRASGGLTLSRGEVFRIGRTYADAGGDILKFHVRDLDGSLDLDLTPTEETYYSGTVGSVLGPTAGIELTGIFGDHRLELWAEDSHGSRSEKVGFVVTLVDI